MTLYRTMTQWLNGPLHAKMVLQMMENVLYMVLYRIFLKMAPHSTKKAEITKPELVFWTDSQKNQFIGKYYYAWNSSK